MSKLSAGSVKKNGPCRLFDGNGLWLYVSKTNSRRWIYRYKLNGKSKEIVIGHHPATGLAEARRLIASLGAMKNEGTDPQQYLHQQRSEQQTRLVWTFGKCADVYITSQEQGWSNPKHRQQWRNTIDQYCQSIYTLPIEGITTQHVTEILQPLWMTKHETASRLRGRMENIFSWAIVHGYRQHANPAIWRGHLDKLLPRYRKPQQHHSAMPYADVPAFHQRLAQSNSTTSLALQLCILTATRTNEILSARKDEIQGDVWVIPAERMKAGIEHRIPLTSQAIAVIEQLPTESEWLCPSRLHGKHLSNMAMLKALKQDWQQPYTVHGFRSSFRDWAAEQTNYPQAVCEAALAHQLRDKAEAAYQRSDLIEKRRQLMQAWANYVTTSLADVVQFRSQKNG